MESYNLDDILGIVKNNALIGGVPNVRIVPVTPDTSLLDYGPYAQKFIDALTIPLTADEAKPGTYTPAVPPRIAMTGTYDEIQAYFEGDLVAHPSGGPYAWMSDGLPFTPPTEALVAQMLKGTSHKATETITFKSNGTRTTTIEKIAVNAVMAGCKPEYMPVILTMFETGPCAGSTSDSSMGHIYVVSGPIGTEIGMNFGFALFSPGNPANSSMQRAAQLMGLNLMARTNGISNIQRTGSFHFPTLFTENPDTPYETIVEHFGKGKGYTSDNSMLLAWRMNVELNPFMNIEVANPTNLFEAQNGSPEFLLAALKSSTHSKAGMVLLTPNTARNWQRSFPTQAKDVQTLQDWVWDNYKWPAGEWYKNYWYVTHHEDTRYAARPSGIRALSGDYNNLPPNTMIPKYDDPEAFTLIVAGGTGDCWAWGTATYPPTPYSIDKWR